MPELPDLEAYRRALDGRIVGQPIERVTIAHPFLLRTAAPPIDAIVGRRVAGKDRDGVVHPGGHQDKGVVLTDSDIRGTVKTCHATNTILLKLRMASSRICPPVRCSSI